MEINFGFRLLMIGIGRYSHETWRDLDVEAPITTVRDLLSQHGAQSDDVMHSRVSSEEARGALDRWFGETEGDAAVNTVLYWVGHGATADGEHWLVTSNTPALRLTGSTAIATSSLASILRHHAGPDGRQQTGWTLVILDCCDGGTGIRNLVHELTAHGRSEPDGVGFLGAGDEGASFAGSLTRSMSIVLESMTSADESGMSVREFVERVMIESGNARSEPYRLPPHARFSNPRALPVPIASTISTQRRLEDAIARLTPEARTHFFAKAKGGGEVDEGAWYFEGRTEPALVLNQWLRARQSGMFVVTGPPGVGKSAFLGRVVTLANHELRDALLAASVIGTLPAPEELTPCTVDAVIHLSSKTLHDTIARLEEELLPPDQRAGDVAALLAQLSAHRTRSKITIVADALDESLEPFAIAESLLARLAQLPNVRVIVGTRTEESVLGDQAGITGGLLKALGQENTTYELGHETDAVGRYVVHRLTSEESPFHAADPRIALASELASRPGRGFLFAKLAVEEMLVRPGVSYDELEEAMSRSHQHLFGWALARLEVESPASIPLLRGLAYGLGRGLPQRDRVWATAAEAIAPEKTISEQDIRRTLAASAAYIIHDGELGQACYRLAHRTFVEYFQNEGDSQSAQANRQIALAFQRHAQSSLSVPYLNPYIKRYLASHARIGNEMDGLLADDILLDNIDQTRLAAELQTQYFGTGESHPKSSAILRVHETLASAEPANRSAIRMFGALWNGGAPTETLATTAWRPTWIASSARTPHLVLSGHTAGVSAVALGWHADGRPLLASTGSDGDLRLWNPATGTPVGGSLQAERGPLIDVAFVPSDAGQPRVVTLDSHGCVQAWDLERGTPTTRPIESGVQDAVSLACVSVPTDGLVVGLVGLSGGGLLLDPFQADRNTTFSVGQSNSVRVLAIGGRLVAVAGDASGQVVIHDPIGATPVRTLRSRFRRAITGFAAWTNEQSNLVLAVGTSSGSVLLWDTDSGTYSDRAFAVSERAISALAFGRLRDGRLAIAAANEAGVIYLLSASDGALLGPAWTGHSGRVNRLLFCGVGEDRVVVASAGADHTIRLWDPGANAQIRRRYVGHSGPITDLAVLGGTGHSSGSLGLAHTKTPAVLVSGSDDRSVRLWDVTTGNAVRDRSKAGGRVRRLATNSSASSTSGHLGLTLVAAATRNGTIRLIDADARSELAWTLPRPSFSPRLLSFHSAREPRQLLVALGHHGRMAIWDVNRRTLLSDTQDERLAGDPIALQEDGEGLAAVIRQERKLLLARFDGKAAQMIEPKIPATAVAIGLDGKGRHLLALITSSPRAEVWDFDAGHRVARFRLPFTPISVSMGTLSYRGEAIAAFGAPDGRIEIWSVKEGISICGAHLPISCGCLHVMPAADRSLKRPGPKQIMLDVAVAGGATLTMLRFTTSS